MDLLIDRFDVFRATPSSLSFTEPAASASFFTAFFSFGDIMEVPGLSSTCSPLDVVGSGVMSQGMRISISVLQMPDRLLLIVDRLLLTLPSSRHGVLKTISFIDSVSIFHSTGHGVKGDIIGNGGRAFLDPLFLGVLGVVSGVVLGVFLGAVLRVVRVFLGVVLGVVVSIPVLLVLDRLLERRLLLEVEVFPVSSSSPSSRHGGLRSFIESVSILHTTRPGVKGGRGVTYLEDTIGNQGRPSFLFLGVLGVVLGVVVGLFLDESFFLGVSISLYCSSTCLGDTIGNQGRPSLDILFLGVVVGVVVGFF